MISARRGKSTILFLSFFIFTVTINELVLDQYLALVEKKYYDANRSLFICSNRWSNPSKLQGK